MCFSENLSNNYSEISKKIPGDFGQNSAKKKIRPQNVKKKNNLQICTLKKIAFNLQLTYQERRRDGPYAVLATLKMQGAKSHSINGGR